HGKPPTLTRHGRKYPVRHQSDQFKAFEKTAEYKIHGLYEERMLEVATPDALKGVNDDLAATALPSTAITSGHAAAVATLRLMGAAQKRRSPQTIINADDPSEADADRARLLWKNATIRKATIASLADSVRLLAVLWKAAWKAGKGDAVAASKIREYSETEM